MGGGEEWLVMGGVVGDGNEGKVWTLSDVAMWREGVD